MGGVDALDCDFIRVFSICSLAHADSDRGEVVLVRSGRGVEIKLSTKQSPRRSLQSLTVTMQHSIRGGSDSAHFRPPVAIHRDRIFRAHRIVVAMSV
jgi:hypothetical protein